MIFDFQKYGWCCNSPIKLVPVSFSGISMTYLLFVLKSGAGDRVMTESFLDQPICIFSREPERSAKIAENKCLLNKSQDLLRAYQLKKLLTQKNSEGIISTRGSAKGLDNNREIQVLQIKIKPARCI